VEAVHPVQLHTECGFIHAEMRDLSRTGLRFRVAQDALGANAPADLIAAAAWVGETLAPGFSLDLHYRHLGPLIQKQVQVSRIGIPTDAANSLEICCAFRTPIEDHEAIMLDVELPPLVESVETWCPEKDLPETCKGAVTFQPLKPKKTLPVEGAQGRTPTRPAPPDSPRQRYRALVAGTLPQATAAFFCNTDMVTGFGVRVRLPRTAGRQANGTESTNTAEALKAFIERHGASIELRLLKSGEDLWRGATRVSGVELPSGHPDEMLVTLTYNQALSLTDLRRLELVRGVA